MRFIPNMIVSTNLASNLKLVSLIICEKSHLAILSIYKLTNIFNYFQIISSVSYDSIQWTLTLKFINKLY